MKNTIKSLILIVLLILTNNLSSFAFDIPSNLKVPILFQYYLSSEELKKDDKIQLIIAENVYVNNTLLFKKGSTGFAYVDQVKKKRFAGRGGLIKITLGEIYDVYGNKHKLSLTEKVKGESKSSAILLPLAAVGASFILFPYAAILTLGGSVAPLAAATLITVPSALTVFRKGDEAKLPQAKVIYASHLSPKTISIKN